MSYRSTVKKICVGLWLVVIMVLFVCDRIGAQEAKSPGILTRTAGLRSPKPTNLEDAFLDVLRVSHAPGGALLLESCRENKAQVIVPTDATVADAMNLITHADKRYYWVSDNKTVNLGPKYFALSPLDIAVAKLKVKNVPVSQAYRELYEMREVKQGLVARNLREPQWLFASGGITFQENHISLDLKSVTLREALNAIVEADGQRIWLIKIRECGGRYEYVTTLTN